MILVSSPAVFLFTIAAEPTMEHSGEVAAVAVIILIHRREDLAHLRHAVDSALLSDAPNVAIFIVDNASGLKTQLEREFPRCLVLHSPVNLGFAGGNNIGIRHALGTGAAFVLLLNNDATVTPGTISTLLDAIHRHPEAGAVQPLIYRAPGSAAIDSAGQQPLAKGGATDLRTVPAGEGPEFEIFGPCAAVALYRADVLQRSGGFDDTFFIIHEDTDLSMRMRLEGLRSYLVTAATAFHARGVSGAGGHHHPLPRYYAGRNNLVVLLRYWPFKHILFYLPFHLLRYSRVVTSAISARLSIPDLHRALYRAVRQRRRYSRNGFLRETRRRWFVGRGYRDLLLSLLHKESVQRPRMSIVI